MRLLLAIACLLAFSARPVLADWGAAHWGDSPDRLIAALGGQAQRATTGDDDDGVEAFPMGAVSNAWVQGGLPFRAVFYFDIEKDGLRMVKLTPPRGEELCDRLGAWVVSRYGPPAASQRKPVLTIDQWYDTADGNDMRLTRVGDGPEALCSLVYVPEDSLYRGSEK